MGNKIKSNKLITILAVIVVLVVAVTSISAVVAYMIKRSDDVKNTFVPAKIDYDVIELGNGVENFDGEIKTSVKVQSTSNVDTYIRVKVITYWKDSKGNIVGRTSPEVGFAADNSGTWKYNAGDWLYDADDQTFYYKTTLAPHATTYDILSLEGAFTGIKLESVTEGDQVKFTYHPVVTFIVEGIQANPQKAVTESWGVTLASNGNITNP